MAGCRIDGDRAFGFRHDVMDDAEADTGALFLVFCRKKQVEQAMNDIRIDSRTGVFDTNAHHAIARERGGGNG